MSRFNSDYAIHPGQSISEYLIIKKISKEEAAAALELPFLTFKKICEEEEDITPDIAQKLAKFTGTADSFWMKLQINYDNYAKKLLKDIKNFSLKNKESALPPSCEKFYITADEINEYIRKNRNVDNKEIYTTACVLVSERHEKDELDNLVYYLLMQLHNKERISNTIEINKKVAHGVGWKPSKLSEVEGKELYNRRRQFGFALRKVAHDMGWKPSELSEVEHGIYVKDDLLEKLGALNAYYQNKENTNEEIL